MVRQDRAGDIIQARRQGQCNLSHCPNFGVQYIFGSGLLKQAPNYEKNREGSRFLLNKPTPDGFIEDPNALKDFLTLPVRRQDLRFGQAECRCCRQGAGDLPLPGLAGVDILTDLQGGRDLLPLPDQKIYFLAAFVLPVINLAAAPLELAENDIFQYPPAIGRKFEGHRRGQGMIDAVELGRVVHLPLQGIVEEVHRKKEINILEIAEIVLHGRQAVDGDCVPDSR
jgi:hypothetical protein